MNEREIKVPAAPEAPPHWGNSEAAAWGSGWESGYAAALTISQPGPCAKQVVTATIVTRDGKRFVGTNYCNRPQQVCPRAGMATGVGYELCKSVCDQQGHAEVNALFQAGETAEGATLYLEGHSYACDSCKAAADAGGIERIIIGKPEAA